MFLKILFCSIILLITFCNVNAQAGRSVFDNDLYERVLDPELCMEQLRHILGENITIFIQCK